MNTIVSECNSANLGGPCTKIKKEKEYICAAYANPASRWEGDKKCPFRYEKKDVEIKKKINPLKASKKASKRDK